MKIYNTASRKVEDFQPLNPPTVTFYSCGPTVYSYTHIGHIRTYINNDVLKRTLLYLGYQVNHVMNITDVGHLTGDDDSGEDKLEKGAQKSGKSVWDVATYYTEFFINTLRAVNVMPADSIIKATDCIKEVIQLIRILMEKGYTYQTGEAVYFDVTKFAGYGKLSGQKLEEKKQQARENVHIDPNKRSAADFALWFKKVGRFENHVMHWPSPWGEGFPGWHIECSAISMNYLGETIDIHSGGVDHIPVHHENEIAQSEAATGKPFVRYWFHNEFLLVDGQKMSKSLENIYAIEDIKKQGIDPLALRLLFFQTHYRQQMNFTWESAKAAGEAYQKLKEYIRTFRAQQQSFRPSEKAPKTPGSYRVEFKEALANDLQMPQALAVVWEMVKSTILPEDKLDLLLEFDRVLGLKLSDIEEEEIPEEIQKLVDEREQARKKGNFAKADELRKLIQQKGYTIDDQGDSYRIKKT